MDSQKSFQVFFTKSKKTYYDSDTGELYCPPKKPTPISANSKIIFDFLIQNPRLPISRDQIWSLLDGRTEEDEAVVRNDSNKYADRAIDQAIRKLRRLLGSQCDCIETVRGVGYKYVGPLKVDKLSDSTPPCSANPSDTNPSAASDDWPKVLTPSFGNVTEEDVLHRGDSVKELEARLSHGKETILISGFGGIGKTSVARVLYHKLINKYDHIGWVVYSQDLKTSILTAFEVNTDISNQKYRWRVISDQLKAGKKKTLLFVDNVDRDLSKGQDPTSDQLLLEISGWPNISLVLTSRMEELPGYHPFDIGFLADDSCEDLFYFYYDRRGEFPKPRENRANRDAVQRLISRASRHTLAIELLAKSAKVKRSLSLDAFTDEIEHSGFQFPVREVMTSHGGQQSVVNQLCGLFNLNSRKDTERKILWDLSVLPSTVLSYAEIWGYLGYDEKDMDALLSEGWLSPRYGGIYMHPLIKETIHFNLDKEKKAPLGTIAKLINTLSHQRFFDEEDSFNVWIRKFELTNHALGFVDLADNFIPVMRYMGKTAQQLGRITAATYYFRKVLDACNATNTPDEVLAAAYHDLGYQLSYSNNNDLAAALSYLLTAFQIRKTLFEADPHRYAEDFATSCDHLGYVLSDNDTSRDDGEQLLRQALLIREKLAQKDPTRYLHDEAWTRDNLGYLLSMISEKHAEAQELLCDALATRKHLESQFPGKYLTEVAWTCGNLASLLQRMGGSIEDAENLYKEATHALQSADQKKPGVHAADMAHNDNNLAVLLSADPTRHEESIELLKQARKMLLQHEQKPSPLYTGDIAAITGNLAAIASLSSGNAEMRGFSQIIERTSQEVLSAESYRKPWDALHNFALFYHKTGDYKNAIKLFYQIYQKATHFSTLPSSPVLPLMHVESRETAFRLHEVLHFDSPDYTDDSISDDVLARMDKVLSASSYIMFTFSGARTIRMLRPTKQNRMTRGKEQ